VVIVFPNTTIHLRNSARWLETRFFQTPVLRARLERRRREMALVLYMRSAATPQVSTDAAPGGTFHYVYIDFPPGDYGVPAGFVQPAPVQVGPGARVAPSEPPPPAGFPPQQPPSAPARPLDPSLQALDNEAPPPIQQ
jgi:superfamily II DNA/RNA helicase